MGRRVNVISVKADQGSTGAGLFEALYGEAPDWHTAGWRELVVFSS
ncbi:hypothetical protein J3R80_05655 [Aliiroseovarius sp. Z3]|nr:hypothetical protein [Aliiroseovarius sp. Z3]